MFKIFSRNKTIAQKKEQWFFALEKMVNIALVKAERRDNKTVKQILKELENFFRQFWELKKSNPEKFDSLLWSTDFFDRYVVPLNQRQEAEIGGQTKNAEELRQKAGLILAFAPERELRGLTQFLESYEKIWESASQNNNDEISRYVVYHLNWLLAELVQESDNQLFVEQFLKLLNSISYKAIKNAKLSGKIEPSVYSASIHWYTDIVFNRQGFDLSYLGLFDKYFFSTVKYIVLENQTDLFKALVSSLVDGIHIPDYNRGEVWNYGHFILDKDSQKYKKLEEKHGIEKQNKELANSENDLNTQEKLDVWLKKFDELKIIIEQNLNEEEKKEAGKIEEKVRDFVTSQFKYKNLLEIVFAIGAYCLSKQRYAYIKYLWEYKQPPDSDVSWIGHDISPRTVDAVIQFYFKKGVFDKNFDFWDDRHGTEKYYKQYFLLLLARVLQAEQANTESKYPQIENYQLPDLHVYRLSDLKHSIDEFVGLAGDLKKAGNMLAELGLDTTKLDELFGAKLIPFLEKLKKEASKQISAKHKAGNISQKRIEEFKGKVLKSFYEKATLRDVFVNYLKAYEDKTKDKITDKKERFGIGIVDSKAPFFDEWHVNYMGRGENYGNNLASGENSYLLDDVAEDCQEISKENFENTLSKFENAEDLVIFTTDAALWRFFEASENFGDRNIKPLKVQSFVGWYNFKDQSIPVFLTYHQTKDNQILILNKAKLGKLVQLSPLNNEEDEKSLEGIFYIDVQAFSENQKLMDEFIGKPPKWLKDVGDEQKQREYLQERVRIQIFERFEYIKPKDFEGYKLILK